MLGFGLFIGSIITAGYILPQAFRDSRQAGWLIFAGGILAWLILPSLVEGLLGFLIGAASPPILTAFLLHTQISVLNEQRHAEEQKRAADQQIVEARKAAAKLTAEAWPASQKGWTHITRARLMHQEKQPKCFFMMSENRLLLRVVEYSDQMDFEVHREFGVAVNSVLSMNIARPTVKKFRNKTTPVTTISRQDRSPVARGIVGGALLGPAGVVLGAASGLNGKISSEVHHETVTELYDTLGDPQLIIGTRDPDRPVLKMKFDPPSAADEWMFRIEGAK